MTQRPIPKPDELSADFWAAAARGELVVQRCADCRTYWHPPRDYCLDCESTMLVFEPVSGRGRVYSVTRTESGARHPAFAGRVPYLVGLVELEEQEGLVLMTNFPGAELDEVVVGANVEVVFEEVGEGVAVPQFRLATDGAAS